jgi:DNA polymerase-3 subunit delta
MVRGEEDAYLFCGQDSFSREEAQKRLISRLLPSGPSALSYDIYNSKNYSAEIFKTLNTLPFISDRRVVVIKDIEGLPEPRKKPFLAYLESSHKHIFLVMQSDKDTFENKFLKSISTRAKTEIFKRPTLSEIKYWIHDRLRRQKKAITKDALDLIIELKGRESLAVLSGELEKLLIYKGGDKIIKQEDVIKLVGKSAVKRAFALVDAISCKDRDSALLLVHELSSGGRKAIPEMLGLMGWQLRRIWKAKIILAKGRDKHRLSSELNIKAFSMERFLSQVDRFPTDELKRDFKLLVEADRDIKRSRNRPDFILEELVVGLCRCP